MAINEKTLEYEESRKVSVEIPENETILVSCGKCTGNTKHKILTKVRDLWDCIDIQGFDNFQTIQCLGCETVSFRKISGNSDDWEIRYNPFVGEDEQYYPEHEEFYPARVVGKIRTVEDHFLPERVRNIYRETYIALASKLNLLAGIGIRGLIESVCNEQGMSGNLEQKINELVAKGILTKSNADILHEIRFIGNQSAHEFETTKDQELRVAFSIAENLLKNLYEIPKMAESLKRKSAQGASK